MKRILKLLLVLVGCVFITNAKHDVCSLLIDIDRSSGHFTEIAEFVDAELEWDEGQHPELAYCVYAHQCNKQFIPYTTVVGALVSLYKLVSQSGLELSQKTTKFCEHVNLFRELLESGQLFDSVKKTPVKRQLETVTEYHLGDKDDELIVDHTSLNIHVLSTD